MIYPSLASQRLFLRVLGIAFSIVFITLCSGSVFPQSASVQLTVQLQPAIEKNAASEIRVHFPKPQEASDLRPLQGPVIRVAETAPVALGLSESKHVDLTTEDYVDSRIPSRPESGKTAGSETVANNVRGDLDLVKPSREELLGESWRPFEMFPRQNRFSGNDNDDPDDSAKMPIDRFHWKDAILQSMMIQGVQHAYALAVQEKTRRALKGPFFRDYWNSVKGLKGWDDGNKLFTNYIAHPMQGAMTGFIFLQNHDRLKRQKFGESRQYWKDRFRAFVWSAAWSANWELGPISQASIGNVGHKGGMGYVDIVMTPTAGTGWMVVEEALDRYVIRHIESKNFLIKIFTRTLMNPMRSVANALRFKTPWYRDRPFGY